MVEKRTAVYKTLLLGERCYLLVVAKRYGRLDAINQVMKKKVVSDTINLCYRSVGLKETVIFADQLMYTGFRNAALAGVSIGVDDMVVPEEKESYSCLLLKLKLKTSRSSTPLAC